ncbi:aminotransferase class I/II-fold pyridoxal phosphate-dependent enzyme [Marinomonas mediterranea]|jgi:Aspartate/tyrosine/aromatic aminotransferase|uniref:Aminotransferase n=1 Tax=Marinomonas mediterranea (strain ATCC 700492 / JCM 21426 / NBRC 103028 / MMB-1) TaxID=717774 RepID=F2JV58_MARM1|nr:aminotransferase class I/II-fold pyridoxal phosphate-dependent enzyme [Marinomonas mediterranea]ADZ92816.1 Aspartate transaminase [Marinomonas mediterranea MMB-1]WCN10749.1 aminotransferase class I/II-fold pyridoxal phosphate-dependent enzyme [Marinomonas mediterranea]WCN14806.1 aminotransferase class I/II-fold pyridoxal phosphate-dependent enzyme [Marinomonas mediterranea]WCN18839.1 aminotransferase class I/II-fold pyridoxal phosphate-dependent enzyme [Marinomonas mediterranea MMB-1]
MNKLASRVEKIAPFQVMAVLERAKQLQATGLDVIHLEVGEPDFVAPQQINEAGQKAIADGNTGYTPANGLPELKTAISQHYRKQYEADVHPDRIIVTPGASGALLLMASLMVESGSNVLMPDPCYPCNRHFLIQCGAQAKLVETQASEGFSINLSNLDDWWDKHTSGMWLASPSNPTGAVLSKEYVTSAWREVSARGGHLLVDEIYQGLVYDGDDFTALSINSDIFVINSFSKYFAMTGWRLGWIVVPEWAVEGATKLAQNLFISAPSVSQYAAIQAFDTASLEQCEKRRQEFSERRNTLLKGLAEIGLPVVAPAQGAFYAFVDVSEITDDAMKWCLDLLEEEHVALTPGTDFGVKDSHKYVRFAYTCNQDRLREALSRIKRFINR